MRPGPFAGGSPDRLANRDGVESQKVNVNGYMTFGPGGAFAMHYDTHDVLVLQVDGTKHWFIYDDAEDSPMLEEKRQPFKARPRNVVFETILQPGDALYVPRGTYHRAAVTDTDSVHLTFGIYTAKGVHLRRLATVRGYSKRHHVPQRPSHHSRIGCSRGARACPKSSIVRDRPTRLLCATTLRSFKGLASLLTASTWVRLRKCTNLTVLAPLVRYPTAWQDSLRSMGREPSPTGERIIAFLVENAWATLPRSLRPNSALSLIRT